jgi:hypothetical protein
VILALFLVLRQREVLVMKLKNKEGKVCKVEDEFRNWERCAWSDGIEN